MFSGASSGAALSPAVRVQLPVWTELQVDQTQVPAPPRSLAGSHQEDGELHFLLFYQISFSLLLIERLGGIFALKIIQF